MNFVKTFLASILGTLCALFVLMLLGFFILMSSSGQPEPYIRDHSVLKINLSGSIPERSTPNPFDEFFASKKGAEVSIASLRENLRKAAADDKIAGVWLNIDFVKGSWATLQEVRGILQQYQDTTDKFLYASTSDLGFNEKGYYLATAADSIFSPPSSIFEFDGFAIQTTFYKNLFDKIGIDVKVFRRGKYKSAVEPFIRTEYSKESAYQLRQIVEQISGEYLKRTSEASGLSVDTLNQMLNSKPHLDVTYAYENGLIHQLAYPSKLDTLIKRRVNPEDGELHIVKNSRYNRVSRSSAGLTTSDASNKIAVLYASGPIVPQAPSTPFNQQQYITATSFRNQLETIRENDNIKALVLRINSPGGSGSTSDVIWHMLRETSEEIPVIASMGGTAASGGYYIAMAADTIVAQPTTITGSIGVFGTKFNTKTLFNDKLGITFDVVKSHDHANWLNPNQNLSSDEAKAFQHFIDQFYKQFIAKVAKSRNLTREKVREYAKGRVWTGADAKKHQLVDLLGGIPRSIKVAAEKAGVDKYQVNTYPKPENLFEILMKSAGQTARSWLPSFLWNDFHTKPLKKAFIQQKGHPLALMPYKITVK